MFNRLNSTDVSRFGLNSTDVLKSTIDCVKQLLPPGRVLQGGLRRRAVALPRRLQEDGACCLDRAIG